MSYEVGKLSEPIIIQSATISQSTYGEPVETWSTFAEVWAAVNQVSANERFRNERFRSAAVLAARTAKFTIRDLEGLTENMRITWDGATWLIKGINKWIRQGITEIAAEVIN